MSNSFWFLTHITGHVTLDDKYEAYPGPSLGNWMIIEQTTISIAGIWSSFESLMMTQLYLFSVITSSLHNHSQNVSPWLFLTTPRSKHSLLSLLL